MQINNDDAINFYKKHGFDVKETKKDYYQVTAVVPFSLQSLNSLTLVLDTQKIEPTDAHVLVKPLKAEGAEGGAK